MSRYRPVVLVDMDGVLMNWMDGWSASVARLTERAGIEPFLPPFDQIDTYHLFTYAADEQQKAVMADAFADPELYHSLVPMPGAVDAMRQMREHYEVFVCSAPDVTNPGCIPGKLATLREHFGNEVAQHAVFAYDKTVIAGDVLIDDKPVIHGCRQPMWGQVVFDQPYNRDVPLPRLDQWSDWADVLPRR